MLEERAASYSEGFNCHVDPMSGHMGVKRTLNRISERFIWPGMVKDVNDTVVCSLRARSGFATLVTPQHK